MDVERGREIVRHIDIIEKRQPIASAAVGSILKKV